MMDTRNGALLLHSSVYKNTSALPRGGSSGICISRDWILTHGTALSSIIGEYHTLASFIRNMPSRELTMLPQELMNELTYQVYRRSDINDTSSSNGHTLRNVQQHPGFIVAAWKCRLLGKTFDEFFETWSFPKSSAEFDPLLRTIFLLVRICDYNDQDVPLVTISMSRLALRSLLDRTLQTLVRGTLVEIVSTPFGNPVFIDSIARGVISNVIGDEGCIIMTDAFACPGGEGAPVYVISSDRNISGMVIAPLSWCRGERVDYTFAANLAPCLFDILQKKDIPNHLCDEETIDRGVVLVRCGINWGTGILVDKNTGIFLTCSHVVAEAPERETSIVMRTDNKSNSRVSAKLLYRTLDDQPYDVAVLQVNPQDMDLSLKAIRLSNVPVLRGEPVLSVGFPFSSSVRPTVSSGVVSTTTTDRMILTTCCAQSGASGGPVISRVTGEMLGMIASNASLSDGTVLYPRMSLAVPATVLNGPLREYLRTGNPGVFRAFTCNDELTRKIWDLQPLLPSKL